MALINQGIVDNVGGNYIETYLHQKGLSRTADQEGISVIEWLNNLLINKRVDEKDFEKFLFQELFLGKRKLIRVYQLNSIRKIKYWDDWHDILLEKYSIKSLDFNAILTSYRCSKGNPQIAAIHYNENGKGELTRIQILFVCFIQVIEDNGCRDSYAYIPVDIDFMQKIMILKAWNRNYVSEEYRADILIDQIKNIMSYTFGVTTRNFMIKHRQVLYNMSKGILDDVYNKIPAFGQISKLQSYIEDFEQLVFKELPIENLRQNENGKKSIPKGVMEFSDEIKKAVERLAISDYFFDKRYEQIWNMGIDAVIARIKFNDSENILASLSGEESEKPIFCAKTFMYLKKSMEDSRSVERLWIVKNRNKGRLNIRYDATNDEYLGILIRFGIRYTEEDINAAMEIYSNYETGTFKKITNDNTRNVG
ncbi:MAG: hypothetical protein Q4D45_11825 [Lachnospiraceae bacterium]|nr:hypothetical protein [Lachnospiraceae bacterium]